VSARALPTLVRVGFAEAVAYRAELLVWVLSTSMPLIMMALWTAVAADAPVGRFDEAGFVAYFLATFVVRQLNSSWVAWELNFEIRTGALATRLLRPLHPLVAYAIDSLASLPLRSLVALPVAALLLATKAGDRLASDPASWALWIVAVAGGWLISFFAGAAIGSVAFWTGSSTKLMEAWLALFFVFSGYTIPLALFPPALARIADLLPLRYQLGLPVELMIGSHDVATGLRLVAIQWLWVATLCLVANVLWRRGLTRFGAFGG
jgi:ABC-2 type transport system permease protein